MNNPICSRRSFLRLTSILALVALTTVSCAAKEDPPKEKRGAGKRVAGKRATGTKAAGASKETEVATFGSGCFWCGEAIFERVKGVEKVESGYSGGAVANPTYKDVSSGRTGHAEVLDITFDPKVISYAELLEIFWKTHDPTTLNQQGPDFGTQYRSVVFYHDDKQKETAIAYKRQLEESHAFKKPIVTEISPFKNFYRAEGYHQDYYTLNRRQPYCVRYISPKIKKFNRQFKDKLKDRK